MKKKAFLIGAVIWGLVALAVLAVFVMGLTGRFEISGLLKGRLIEIGGSAELIKTETFSLEDINSLEVSSAYSDITINLVPGKEMTVRQYDLDSANQFTSALSGKHLSIKVEPRNFGVSFAISYWPRLEIDLPAEYADAVGLHSGSGSVRCQGAAPEWADTLIETNSGDIRFDVGISSDALRVSTGSGTVHLGDIKAGQIEIETNSGNHNLDEVRATGHVRLKSGSGNIGAGEIHAGELQIEANSGTLRLNGIDVEGAIFLGTGSGNINANNLRGESVDVDTNSGTIHLGDIEASGRAHIESGSGNHNIGDLVCGSYRIDSNSGTLDYDGISGGGSITSGSGNIKCEELDVRGDCSVESNSGTVRIGLAGGANLEINLSSNSGSIRTGDLELYYKNQHGKEAIGTVGDGSGGALRINTGSGNIIIDD